MASLTGTCEDKLLLLLRLLLLLLLLSGLLFLFPLNSLKNHAESTLKYFKFNFELRN